MNYTIYHCHTENSLLDSVTNFESYYKFAKDNNMKSMAISEHGNAISWIKKKQFCNSLGLKYIHAVEIYLTESLEEKIRDNYHTILIAKNFDGVKEINKLISISTYKDHYYYKPRISFDEFLNTSSNIISISACMASPLNKLDKNNKYYNLLCKKYDYYEIQPHIVKEQIEYNKYLYELSLEYNKPLILGTDTHASSEYKSECRKIIKSAKHMEYDDEDKYDLSLKTYDELINMCKNQNCFNIDIYKEAINNTNIMADIISDFEFDKSFKYPKLYTNEEKEFKDFVNKKWKEKSHLFEDKKTYLDRIHEEFDLFKKQGMMSFMLFMGEMSEWCENNDIPRGYGRGSVTGSLIAYLFDITDVNPIIWNTNLARFCNPERISLGDIDVDYAPKDRDRVYKYIENRFGEFKTSRIMALGTISDMGTIQEIGRALNLTIPEVNDIKELFEENQEEAKNKYPNVFKYYDGLINSVIRTSFHPCGILASPITLDDNIGLLWNDKEEIWISQCDMKEVDSLNYVKFDILGLANIGIIKDVYKLIGSKYLKSHEINWKDEKVYEEMKLSGVGIFQMESAFAHKSLCDIKASSIEDISIVNALIRPACESIREKALKREFNKNPSEFIDDMLKNTYGYMIYQESILEFLQKVCGFTGGQADGIRRCVDEDTLITMSNGNLKKIKDIVVGDYVQSLNDNIYEYNMVNNVFKNGSKECYKVVSEHGYELICTNEHEILTQDGYKKLKNISTEDYIITPYKINAYSDNIPSSYRLEEKDMFLIGMMIGDGSLGDKNGIHFTNSEFELIEKFKDCVNNRLKNKVKCDFNIIEQDGITVNKIYSIYIKSKNYKDSVINLFEKYNLICKSNEKHIPEEILNYPIGGKIENLLAGLFNTDGGYNSQSNYIEYYSKSVILVNQIKNILLKYGIYSYVSKKFVKDYNYYSNSLIIRHPASLQIFLNKIVSKMIGNKKYKFTEIINKNISNEKKYNYIIPLKYKNEIIDSSLKTSTSIRSIGKDSGYINYDMIVSKSGNMTDIKAKKIIPNLYCPETYKLIMSDYIPLKIKKIEYIGMRNVYDIEVNKTHNYVANNITVHNCIGKKQIEKLYELLPLITDGYCKLSNKSKDIAEEEVRQYMRVIEDAGNYGFSRNHSTPYSMIGYNCAYLRHYYPKEFLVAYMNNMENESDISNATNLARIKGIDIKNPKFGVFNTDYSIKDGIIYKGLRSIKYVSDDCINDLSKLDNVIYTTFYDLYKDIKEKCSINSRQIFALTIIDYFKDFGKTKKILDFIEYFDIIYKKKQIKKEKCNEFLTSIIKPIPSETNTQYKDFDYDKILYEIWNKLEDIEIDINEQIKYQLEYMGYISVEIPKNISIATVDVVSSKNAWVKLISARDNKEAWFCFEKKPKKHDIIKILPQDIEVKRSDYRRESKWVKKYEIIK